ncbi:hypothetical protein CHS0354_016064 [Potamilus streckersoni]|uniref:Uncharacterized protein n=1 Tax=Potamilus streckersoni TaxID=2493646 RepID=A0AAE0T1T9_9BIVA|nr:hypothetical protein CHS0354_016064 [Potamilus streckersoni]
MNVLSHVVEVLRHKEGPERAPISGHKMVAENAMEVWRRLESFSATLSLVLQWTEVGAHGLLGLLTQAGMSLVFLVHRPEPGPGFVPVLLPRTAEDRVMEVQWNQ